MPRGTWFQVWRYGPPFSAESGLDEAIALCNRWGLAGLVCKAFDGATWAGQFGPPRADELRSLEQVAEQRERCRAAGLDYACWVVPLHGAESDLEEQAVRYAEVGRIVGTMVWDVEPYDGFWGAWQPAGDAARLLDRFRALAPDCLNLFQPDPRPNRLAELRPEEWLPRMNGWLAMDYWPEFSESPLERLAASRAVFERFRADGLLPPDAEWSTTLPGGAPASELTEAVQWLGTAGASGALVWRLGTTGPDQLEALRAAATSDGVDAVVGVGDCAALRTALRLELSRRRLSRKRLAALVG